MIEISPESDIIPVVFATNDNYAPYLDVALCSLIAHASHDRKYCIYILHTDLSAKYIKRIGRLATDGIGIEFIDVKKEVSALNYSPAGRVSVETVYRIVIPDILPQYDKIVYLDCDVIVLKDIALLFAEDIDGFVFGVTANMMIDSFDEYVKNVLNLDPAKYFNAGVLVINSRKFRAENIKERCFELLDGNTGFICWDQDALNIACREQVGFIDKRWNAECPYRLGDNRRSFFLYNGDLHAVTHDPYIIHYSANVKPWSQPDFEQAEYFWRYARGSIFYEEILFKNFQKRDDLYNCFQKYILPFDLIKKNKNIIIYGAGKVGEAFYRQLKITRYGNLLIWCDKDYQNIKSFAAVSDPSLINRLPYDYVVIAVKDEEVAEEIKKELFAVGVNECKMIWSNPCIDSVSVGI